MQEWRVLAADGRALRLLVAIGLGTAAFSMQDILLEPYGAEILGMSVSATTTLTAIMAAGALLAFGLAAKLLDRGRDPHALAAIGVLVGLLAFSTVIFASPLQSRLLFQIGAGLIGFSAGLFAVSLLTAAMNLTTTEHSGLALGAWGAVQATAAGLAIAAGGAIRDMVGGLAMSGQLGAALAEPATGYSIVYHIEILLLFATLIALGPLVRRRVDGPSDQPRRFGLAEFPT
jgi:BCD family chlorophyll transporter-like MFS transporter